MADKTIDATALMGVDLGVAETGDLQVRWQLRQPVPARGVVLLSLMVTTARSYPIRREIGYKAINGEQAALFVFDYDTGRQATLDGAADVTSESVSVLVPKSALGYVHDWQWWATVNIDGKDVDRWPRSSTGDRPADRHVASIVWPA